MGFINGFFRGFLNSIIFSLLFSLVGISLFVGDFPPSVSQVKKVYGEYKSLIKLKERLVAQSNDLPTEALVGVLEQGKETQLRKLASSRNPSTLVKTKIASYEDYYNQVDQIGAERAERNPQSEGIAEASQAPPSRADIPKEWQEQFYNLRAEVFRLNQRVLELERRKTR